MFVSVSSTWGFRFVIALKLYNCVCNQYASHVKDMGSSASLYHFSCTVLTGAVIANELFVSRLYDVACYCNIVIQIVISVPTGTRIHRDGEVFIAWRSGSLLTGYSVSTLDIHHNKVFFADLCNFLTIMSFFQSFERPYLLEIDLQANDFAITNVIDDKNTTHFPHSYLLTFKQIRAKIAANYRLLRTGDFRIIGFVKLVRTLHFSFLFTC